ncbi:MAG: hypothetical protein P8M34_03575, partial [Saprospiraceae bacterium]|nr:hypothetical protein [Saprospiraceae bacterium]
MIKKVIGGFCFLLVIGGFALYTPDKSIEFLKTKYADQDSRFVNIHGMDIHYKIEGEGMPLLLLHGTGSSLHTWDDWTN